MASNQGPEKTGDVDNADDAMNAALAAERRAQQAVDECQEEADRIVEQARQQARRIADRTDTRISRVHNHCAEATRKEVHRLQSKAENMGQHRPPDSQQLEILEAAVRRLAARLTSAATDREE